MGEAVETAVSDVMEESAVMEHVNVNKFLNAEIGGFSIGKIISAIVVLIVCLLIKKLLNKAIKKIIGKSSLNDRVQTLIEKVIDITLTVIIVLITASALGINTTSLIAIVTAFSLGITLALNDILANIAGGIVMMTAKIFKIGDYIEVGGVEGTVKEMHLAHTKIETLDNQVITVPNKDISSSKVKSYTANTTRRTNIVVTASYEASKEVVKKALMEAITDEKTVLSDPAPSVFITQYGESSIEYTLYFWTKNGDFLSAKLNILDRISDKFAKYDIEMTYNHLNIHMIDK
ncbi:MAG: mechanosensitive ion channel [Lachnospiraceae bacterium]|nr:mechanosensitive ion channel [Lachnospiraceae bacterium]